MILPMTPMSALRANPHFAPLFRRVHPLFWWVLWWNLNRLLDWFETAGYEEILYSTNPWGFIRIAYLGDKTSDPSAYRPYELSKPRWDDACWSTNVPMLFLASAETQRPRPNPPPQRGGGGWLLRGQTEGACSLTVLDTS